MELKNHHSSIDKNLLCQTTNILLILEIIGAQKSFLLGLILLGIPRKTKGIDPKPHKQKEAVACKKLESILGQNNLLLDKFTQRPGTNLKLLNKALIIQRFFQDFSPIKIISSINYNNSK